MACRERNRFGNPCQAPQLPGREFCFTHDPARELERADARRRGGLSVHYGSGAGAKGAKVEPVRIRSIEDVLDLLERAAEDALSRKVSIQRARTLAYIATASLRAVEVGELAARIAAIEARLTLKVSA